MIESCYAPVLRLRPLIFANIALGVAEVVAYGTGVGGVPVAVANLTVNSAGLYKIYKQEGFSSKFGVQVITTAAGPAGGVISKGAGVVIGGIASRVGFIYSNTR